MNYNLSFNKIPCGLLVCKNDPYSTIITANDAFFHMIGYTRSEMKDIHKNHFANLVLDNLDEILEKVARASTDKKILDYEYRIRHRSGKTIWIHDVAAYDPETDTFNVAIMDITYKEKLLRSLSKSSKIDRLTGLLNRSALEDSINILIGDNSRKESQTMILIDLDNFKSLNDLKGHQEGDKFLAEIGVKLKNEFRSNDIIGRLGGDEFMIFFKGLKDQEVISKLTEKLLKILRVDIHGVEISASIGLCMDLKGKLIFDELYNISDTMLYQVKENGKNHYKIKVIK